MPKLVKPLPKNPGYRTDKETANTMSWPLASHFSAMLQNPRVAFRDPQFQRSSIEKNEQNQPRPWAGAFAVVYKGIGANGTDPFAVRVFTTESPERRERYDHISAYLKSRKLDCLVDFEYRDRSIRSGGDGKWYPLIIMEWVQGDTLFRWARAQCLQGNAAAMAKAAERWVELVKELAGASLAHGDLQHANVMVTEAGKLKLVDYDCMCVPALVGRRNLEVGVEPYQHPGRNERTLLSLDLDNFSALVIYVALRALAASPQLWHKHIERTGYDKLLFRGEDFRAPAGSALHRDLMQSPDREVRELTEKLFARFRGRMDQVPPLSHLASSYAKVEQLLLRQNWKAAVKALNRRGHFQDAPDHLQPLIQQAYEYVCRLDAWTAYCKIPRETSEPTDRKLVDAWNERLFAGYEPAERERVRVAEARRRVTLVDRIYQLVQQSSGAARLTSEQALVDAAARLPQGYQHSLSVRVERARRCVTAVARLEKVLGEPVSEAAIVAAWRAATEAKCDDLVDDARRARVELAERRAPVIKALADVPDDLPLAERDRRLLETWNEELLGDCREAEKWRPAHEAAIARKKILKRLQTAVDRRDGPGILELIHDPCMAGYPLPDDWTAAIKAAREMTGRTEDLLGALRDKNLLSLHQLFDVRMIRQNADRFAPYESLLSEWTRSEVLTPEKLRLRSAGRKSVTRVGKPEGGYCVRWIWPEARFCDRCLLAICPEKPAEDDDPEKLAVHYRVAVDLLSWEGDGGSRLIDTEPDWEGSYVVVWAVVDLGFQTLNSRPLVLGRLKGRSRWNWRDWKVFSSARNGTPDNENENQSEAQTE